MNCYFPQVIDGGSLVLNREIIDILINEKDRNGRMNPSDVQIQRVVTGEEALARRQQEAKVSFLRFLRFYGCSYMFHLSGNNSRDRYIKGS